jgi:hypothetical protein
MPRRTKDSTRRGSPIVIELKSQDDDAFEFEDMSRRGSSKEPARSVSREEPDGGFPVFDDTKSPEDGGFEEIPRATKRRVPARTRPRDVPSPVVVETKLPEDGGFEFQDISYTTPAGKVLIQGISASVGKGEMLAVMVCLSLSNRNRH